MIRISKEQFGMELEIERRLKHKKTARCPYQYIGRAQDGKQYLVVNARSSVQKFYLRRSVEYLKEMEPIFQESRLCLNMPIAEKTIGTEYYVIYPYFNKVMWSTGTVPKEELLKLQESYVRTYLMDNEVLAEIKKGFLSAWPEEYHSRIVQLESFQQYMKLIRKHKEIKICFEHGDYTANNVLLDSEGTFWLVDFEFFKPFQPVGSDIYDWHCTTDGNYQKVPYYTLNHCKHRLMDEINDLLDKSCRPHFWLKKIGGGWNPEKIELVPDFIYNQVMFYEKNSMICYAEAGGNLYPIPVCIEKGKASIGVWLTELEEETFRELFVFLFRKLCIYRIEYRNSINEMDNAVRSNHWHIILPTQKEELWKRLSSKHRYNMRREKKKAEEIFGRLELLEYHIEIPDSVVEYFFINKQVLAGTDYHMQPQEYIQKFYVTNAYMLQSENRERLAVLFSCEQGKCVYLENLTYSSTLAEYSFGKMIYTMFLERMIEKEKEAVFLGDGNQEYKRYFGGLETEIWNGIVYRNKLFDGLIRGKRKHE